MWAWENLHSKIFDRRSSFMTEESKRSKRQERRDKAQQREKANRLRTMGLIVAGRLKPIMDRTFALKDAAIAQERLWRNENFGKITLDIGG